jgi:chromosome segregation ATPase
MQVSAQKSGSANNQLFQDINSAFDNAESNIENEFEKLKKACSDNIDMLNRQINGLESQVAALKNKADKIKDIAVEDKKAKDSLRLINKNLGQLQQQQKEKQHNLIVLQQRKARLEADKENTLDALKKDRKNKIDKAIEINNEDEKRTDDKRIRNYTKALIKKINSTFADSLRSINARYKPINR